MANQLLDSNDLNLQDNEFINGTDNGDVIIADLEDFSEEMSGIGEDIAEDVETAMSEAGMVDGTDGNDKLTGSFVSGLEGNDTLLGKGSDNMLIGDEGNDLLKGAGGNADNMMIGGDGNDNIYARGASNMIIGGDDGADTNNIWLNGGDNGVVLTTGSGHEVINNFDVDSTTLFVEDIDKLSFVGSGDDTKIMQGDDLLAVATDQSPDVFADNETSIFETSESTFTI